MRFLTFFAALCCLGSVMAETDPDAAAGGHLAILEEGINPGEFWIDSGDALFHAPRGPNNVSLEECDFGKGPGVLEGAYAELPRYFEDTKQVMDLEARLMHCMVELQGFDREKLVKTTFAKNGQEGEWDAIVTYIAAQSNGLPLNPPMDHPLEKRMRETGEALFWVRAGPMDFNCANCHAGDNQRIRLQKLANIYDKESVDHVPNTWPAFRFTHQTVRTMQHRINECYWQMRMPYPDFASEATIALTSFMSDQARGAEIAVPGLKR